MRFLRFGQMPLQEKEFLERAKRVDGVDDDRRHLEKHQFFLCSRDHTFQLLDKMLDPFLDEVSVDRRHRDTSVRCPPGAKQKRTLRSETHDDDRQIVACDLLPRACVRIGPCRQRPRQQTQLMRSRVRSNDSKKRSNIKGRV
jgi:hypothetical protein